MFQLFLFRRQGHVGSDTRAQTSRASGWGGGHPRVEREEERGLPWAEQATLPDAGQKWGMVSRDGLWV